MKPRTGHPETVTAVRAAWERVLICDGSYRHYAKGTILLNWSNHRFYEFKSFAEARAFTDERRKQIADVEEEIKAIQLILDSFVSHGGNVLRRILAREQATLAELKRGWKEN